MGWALETAGGCRQRSCEGPVPRLDAVPDPARVAPVQRPQRIAHDRCNPYILVYQLPRHCPVTAPDFGFVANHPALDFCNTVGAWRDGRPERDQLLEWEHVIAWARGAGLLGAAEAAALRRPGHPSRLLGRARALRAALYHAVTAGLDGRRPGAAELAAIEREVAGAMAARRLEPARGGYAWRWADPASPQRPLLEVARAAADLLAAPLARVHRCGGEDCGWLFLDTSRAGRRRWCSMSTCGNTAKVRRFRRRNG